MEEMRMDLETMKEFIMKQGDEIARLKRGGNIEEDNCSLESESMLSQRLYDIEFQLSEQKRSTNKITKLCMAAIKALEKLEQKPGGLVDSSFDDCSITSKDSDKDSVDPMMIKTLCEQMDVINKLLLKVDDDIEAVDQKAEDGLSDCEKLKENIAAIEQGNKERCDTLLGEMRAMLVAKTYATREDVSRSLKTIPIPISKEEIQQMIQHAKDDLSKTMKTMPIPITKEEVTQMIQQAREDLSKTCATHTDLSRSIKAIPAPLKKEEVSQMIDRATSNFLRTVHADTASCVEKTQDCEEFVKSEIRKLKTSVEETDNFVRNEARQIQENTEKNMKEVTRTLSNLVEQQQTKANSINVDAYDKLNKRLDNEIKNFGDMMKDLPKEDNKQQDESKFITRMERLGKEISLMKTKQAELSQCYENSMSKQKNLETQNTNIARTLEKHQDEVQKVNMVERNVDELAKKIDENCKLYESSVEEWHKKIDRTELDDIRNGMEKERCKINYFQDKISNIAKSVEGVKIETNNMRDKFCADIEGHDISVKSMEKIMEKQTTQIAENSTALKGITLDSIGKIKDVANNCVQVEMNIRSIRDKSILFDNDLKQIKDQIAQMKYENGNNQQQQNQTFEKEVMKLLKQKDEEVKTANEGIQMIKKKVQQNTADLNNLKEDKRTKEGENEERQSSLEQNLLDVRSYVETMLNETNKQLTDIAIEVENANLRITKCTSDIGEVFHKHADHTGDFSFVIKNLEEKLNDVQEFGNIKQRELLDKILELRSNFVDNQSEFVNKLNLSNESITKLREESSVKIEKIESQVKKNFEANNTNWNKTNQSINEVKTKNSPQINEVIGKLDAFKADHELTIADVKKCIEEGRNNNTKVTADIGCLQKAEESHQSKLKNVTENLANIDKEFKRKTKEDIEKITELKADIEKSQKVGDTLKKEIDTRMEHMRKNFVEMIGINELKTSEIDDNLKHTNDIIKDIKVVQNNIQMNIENKLKATKNDFESVISDSMKTKTAPEIESRLAALKKDVEHVKNELKIGDLESFKSVVNHTTETHNKLISSLQKNIDVIICEKTILESQSAVLDSKVSDILSEKETYESSLRNSIQKESDEREKTREQVNNLQLNMRDIHDKIEACSKLESNLTNLTKNIHEAKDEFTKKVKENSSQITNLEDLLNSELGSIKNSITSTSKLDSDLKLLKNLTSNLQEAKNDLSVQVQENSTKNKNLEDMLNCELNNLKTSVTSSGKSLHEKFMGEFREVTKNIQEKSSIAETQLNEALEMIHNHTRVIDNLSNSVGQVNKTFESSDSQIQKLELKLTSCIDELSKLDQYVTSSDLKKLERSISDKSDKYDANEVENKIALLKQEFLEVVKGISSKNSSLDQMVRDLQSQISSDTDLSSLPDEVQMLSSKVSQQKAKLIDMEANITMQERSTTKLSDDVKKLNVSVSGSINKLEDKFEKLNKHGAISEDTSSKKTTLSTQNGLSNDELHELEQIKAKFDSKSSTWDRKADSSDIDKMHIFITDEVNKIQKEIKEILKNYEVMKLQLQQTKDDENQSKTSRTLEDTFIKKNEFKNLDLEFTKLSDHIHKTMTGNIAKIESKTTNIETFQKDVSAKILELSKNDEKVFKELVTFSALKSKFDSKVESWDKKVDANELRKIDTFINDEVRKLNKVVQQLSEQNVELKSDIKTNSKNGDQEVMAKNLENRYASKEEFKSINSQISNLSADFKKSSESNSANISKCEKKITELEILGQDNKSKLVNLTKINEKLDKNVTDFIGLRNKFEAKADKWDKKAESQDLAKIENHASEERKKIKEEVDNLKRKNSEIDNCLKNAANEKPDTITKNLENRLIENIKQIENKLATFEDSTKDTASKISALLQKNEKIDSDMSFLTAFKSSFDSKVNTWDGKANPSDIKNLETSINEEFKKLRKDIEYILEKNDEIHANLKNASQNENQEAASKNLENKLTGKIASVENKIAIIENSKKETAAKLSDLSSQLETINGEIVSFTEIKSKFNSHVNSWNNKADSTELKKLDTLVDGHVKGIKKDIECLYSKHDELTVDICKNQKDENQETLSKSLENKLSNISQVENRITILDNSKQEITKKQSDLSTKLEKVEKDLIDLFGMKSKFESKASTWDCKADLHEIQKLDKFVNEEVGKLTKNVNSIQDKNEELSNKMKVTSQYEGQTDASKNLENRLTGNIAQLENKIAIIENSRQDLVKKISELLKKNEKIDSDLVNLNELKVKVDTKLISWDNKVDNDDFKKLNTYIDDEIKKIKKDITYVLEKNDEINANIKANANNPEKTSPPKDLENRLTSSIAQIENKIAIFEKSRQDITTKLSDLMKNNEKTSDELTKLGEMKSKFESKVGIWDSKVNCDEIQKINKFVNEEVDRINSSIKIIEQKNDETSLSKLNERFIGKELFKDLKDNVNNISDSMKGLKTNSSTANSEFGNFEAKINKLEVSTGEFNNKFVKLMEKNSQINDEIVGLSVLKSKFDAKSNFWDSKVDSSEITKVNTLLSEEIKKLQNNINSISDRNEEVINNLKNAKDDENKNLVSKELKDTFASKEEHTLLVKSNDCLASEVKKINGSISERVKQVDSKLSQIERSQSEFTTNLNNLSEKDKNNSKFVDKTEMTKFNTQITDEIKKVQKNFDELLEKNENMFSTLKNSSQKSTSEISPKDFITKEEFTVLDINFSKLSEIVENIQCEIFEHQREETSQFEQLQSSMKTLKTQVESMPKDSKHTEPASNSSSGITDLVRTIQTTIGSLESNMNALKADVPSRREFEKILDLIEERNTHADRSTPVHGLALTSIDKQRRGWEEAKEKAEEMAQIFDSLIITNDRPYVSCGLESDMNEPGLLEFSQFELINKVAFDTDTNQFSLLEPGVYLLQMSGSIEGGSLVAKLVSEDVAVDFMILEAGKNGSFKSRSTIFTIEDDDQTAENLLVELVAQGDGVVKLDSDFSFLLYKISEVSNVDHLE